MGQPAPLGEHFGATTSKSGLQLQNLHLCHLRQSLVFPEEVLRVLFVIQDFIEG